MSALSSSLRRLVWAALLSFATIARSAPEAPVILPDPRLTIEAAGHSRDLLILNLRNAAPVTVPITIPAGLIAVSRTDGSRLIVVHAASAIVPARSALEVTVPAAALASGKPGASSAFDLATDREPRLTALLAALASQPDAPRATTQLAVFCLLEDLNFAQWRQFLGATAETPPTPAEVTQAIDALGLLRTVAPERTFALANDADLKARALRNPWSRAKAMAVYGLDFGDGAVPPDLRQLLHTQAGDNCPVCRQRALLQKAADIP